MGGKTFGNRYEVSRVLRDDVSFMVETICSQVDLPYDYLLESLVGSVWLKPDSGDLDFVMNTHDYRFVGEPTVQVFDYQTVLAQLKSVFPVVSRQDVVYALVTNPRTGKYVQCDFIFGKRDWQQWKRAGSIGEYGGAGLSQAKISLGCIHEEIHGLFKASPVLRDDGLRMNFSKQRPDGYWDDLTPEEFTSKTGVHYDSSTDNNPESAQYRLLGYRGLLVSAHHVAELVKQNYPDRYLRFSNKMLDKGYVV